MYVVNCPYFISNHAQNSVKLLMKLEAMQW